VVVEAVDRRTRRGVARAEPSITLGNIKLTNGEIIRIQSTERPGVHVVLKADDDDRDAPRIK